MPARKNGKIDWEKIEIEIVPIDEPNPHNPYAELSPQARFEKLVALYQEIYANKLEKLEKKQ